MPGLQRIGGSVINRHEFIPDVVWFRDGKGWLVPLNRNENPERWRAMCDADEPIITQVDDGTPFAEDKGLFATSSSSAPTLMAEMIEALHLKPGMKTLEIGTGTGYNAAMLAEIAGARNVTTIEVDLHIAEHARDALERNGYQVAAVVGDGALGYPQNAPYDRLISTASVHTIPYSWVAQVRPAGRIVVPVNFPFGSTGALLTLTVQDDGNATGRFSGKPAFMLIRSQRPLEWGDENGPYDESTTEVDPREPFENDYQARFAVAALVPGCQDGRTFEFEDQDGKPALCVRDESSGSWAAFTRGADKHRVRQHGPRRLWDEIETAYLWWSEEGRPNHERFGMTITGSGQHIWLDSPENLVRPSGS